MHVDLHLVVVHGLVTLHTQPLQGCEGLVIVGLALQQVVGLGRLGNARHLAVRVAAARWHELLPMLQSVKVMTKADIEALARYCDTYEWWLATRARLKKEGDTYPILNDKGEIKYIAQRPEVSIAHKLAVQLRQLEQDFGLNPSARTSLHVEEEKPADEEDARMFG